LNLRILSDGRVGHESQTLGVAAALGAIPDFRRLAPRHFYDLLAPFGPADPREAAALAPPWPDIALAAGRRTVPALRRLKRLSGGRIFTVYFNKPATGSATADLVVAPRHDGFMGENVITPTTPANRLTPAILAAARAAPDPRVAALPVRRVALLIGGDSRHFQFSAADAARLAAAAATLAEGPGFLWDGDGPNPYLSILANADAILVTADSVNMASEAAATGTPVNVLRPGGGHPRLAAFHAALEETGASRRWRGALEDWSYAPVNSTPAIAAAIRQAFNSFPLAQLRRGA